MMMHVFFTTSRGCLVLSLAKIAYPVVCLGVGTHPPSLAMEGLYVMFPAHMHSERGGNEDLVKTQAFFRRQGFPWPVFVGFFSDVLDAGVVGLLLCHVLL